MWEVLEVDVQEDGSAWGRCLRVRVECDLRRLIARGRTIKARCLFNTRSCLGYVLIVEELCMRLREVRRILVSMESSYQEGCY